VSTALAEGTTTTVSVTAEHVAEGEILNCEKCPVALAILAAIPQAEKAYADCWTAHVYTPGAWYSADLPECASIFVRSFDNDEPVEPFTFGLTWRTP
jgi:hypothetical protein